jgi:hypothetical protein
MKQIKKVQALADYNLLLKFDNGEIKMFDCKPLLDKPVFQPLKNKNFFKKVHVVYDYTIGWNDDIDLCPDSLYIESKAVDKYKI